jgi:hypothetical protein
VAALLLVSCAALVKRYPDPLAANKYYLRIDNDFYNLTCPNSLIFDVNIEQCIVNPNPDIDPPLPDITWLSGNECDQNEAGYF